MFRVQSCTESCGNGIVDLLIEPCLTVINSDAMVKQASTEVI